MFYISNTDITFYNANIFLSSTIIYFTIPRAANN